MDLSVKLPGLDMKNPVMPASGCFGFGREFSLMYDLSQLGAIVPKTTTLNERAGNNTPRIADTPQGMLNSIGLQNKGADFVLSKEVPFLAKFGIPVLFSVSGSTVQEYVDVLEKARGIDAISAFEINASCPNVEDGAISFGVDPKGIAELTAACKKAADKPVYIKLTPNVTDIVSIAKEAEKAGADGLVLINTLRGMSIDLKSRKPLLANVTGGLSGPAIKPVALCMVYQVSQAVDIPVIGCGGLESAEDVLEFLNAGAQAVQVGSANFSDPYILPKIIGNLEETLKKYRYTSLSEAVGTAHV